MYRGRHATAVISGVVEVLEELDDPLDDVDAILQRGSTRTAAVGERLLGRASFGSSVARSHHQHCSCT